MAETTAHPHLTARFSEALAYTRMIHRDQIRKDTGGVPYLAHLMSTAALALEDGGGEDDAIAALLHDALEDQADRTSEQEIAELFGRHVADIVVECSDREPGEGLSWRERKERYLESIEHKSACALRVSNADKLHNARSIVRDLYQHGPAVWDRFNQAQDAQLWYYTSLAAAFFEHNSGPLPKAFVRTVQEMVTMSGSREDLSSIDPDDELAGLVEGWPRNLEEAEES